MDAELVKANVRFTVGRRGLFFGYDLERSLERRGPFDLVFIDAPAAALGRDGALHACYAFLVPGSLIVLDDSRREREQRTVWRWVLQYPSLQLVAHDVTVGKGVTILKKVDDGNPRFSFAPEFWITSLYDVIRFAPAVRKVKRRATDHIPAI